MKKSFYLFLILTCFYSQLSFADDLSGEGNTADEYPKHGVDLRLAFWNHSQGGAVVNLGSLSVDASTGGISGKIMYNFYSSPELAFTFSVGLMSADVNVETLSTYTSTVIPVMMGLKYYFIQLEPNNALRPYLAGSFGALAGYESGVSYLSVGTRSETTIGGYAGFGTDIVLGSLVKLHAEVGYNLFSDFTQEIGVRKNYSGPELSFGIGFIF
jgi:hypothetical protein